MEDKYLLISTLLWFVLPLAALIVSRSPLYDNFRQVIFILPPVFFVCGLGLDWLFQRIRAPVVCGVIVAALALPGILAGIQLHPYEYIYYNSFIGGERGAQDASSWTIGPPPIAPPCSMSIVLRPPTEKSLPPALLHCRDLCPPRSKSLYG